MNLINTLQQLVTICTYYYPAQLLKNTNRKTTSLKRIGPASS